MAISNILALSTAHLRLTIRTKIVLLFTLAVGIFSAVIAFYVPALYEQREMDAVEGRARSIGTTTAYSIAPALLFDDKKSMEEAFDAALQNRDVIFLSARHDTGSAVAVSVNRDQGLDASSIDELSNGKQRDGRAIRVEVPVLNQGATIGTLTLVLSLRELRENAVTARRLLMVISACVLLAGAIVGLWISKRVTAPLAAMAETTIRIADGDLTKRVVMETDDEVGTLARSFNLMVEKLELSHRALEEVNADLENRVSSRTADLKREIAERAKIEEQLRKLYVAVEQSSVSVVITNVNGITEYVNPKFCSVTGFSREEAEGEPAGLVKSGLTSPAIYKTLWETITAGKEWSGEVQNRRRDGRLYWEAVAISPIRNQRGDITHFLAIKEDVTEKRKLEQELIQAQKMEGLGTLASGIAHEFNNILNIIGGLASLLELDQLDFEVAQERARTIGRMVERGAGVVRQILTFARKASVHGEILAIDTLVVEVAGLVQSTFPKTITVSYRPAPNVPKISVDATQLHQAILNLCVNARDAMPNGGTLKVTTGTADGETLRTKNPNALSDEYVEIAVSDTGTGMAPEIVERIFEPFFTTKEIGYGTGLGLAVVYGIMQAHKGFILVDSEVGRGSTFRLYFPVQLEGPYIPSGMNQTVRRVLNGTEVLLVVEDEVDVLEMLVKTFEDHGYTVLAASDGVQGLKLFEENLSRIDLVVTDLGLPRLDGSSLIERIRGLKPGQKVLVCTGYLNPEVWKILSRLNVDDSIQKPILPLAVLERIRIVLDSPHATAEANPVRT